MTNEMKLLTAFIEASGYEVEEVFDQSKYNFEADLCLEVGTSFNGHRSDYIDYKVTKKPKPLDVIYDGVSLEQLVKNVIELSECNHSERWIKYPKASFDAAIDWFGFQADKQSDTLAEILGVDVFLMTDEDKS